MMAAVGNGGSADDIAPGVDYFGQLKKAGQLRAGRPDPATIKSGQTPGRHRLGLPERGRDRQRCRRWKVVVPDNAVVGGYYYQAINKDAPHPAAARLWEEFLYSDAGQNLWLGGGARPVRADAMVKAGTIDKAAYDALPPVNGSSVTPTIPQTEKAAAYLSSNWAKAVG